MKSLFIFNGKFLECESLLEIRHSTTEEEWFTICKETTEGYCHLRVAKDIGPAKISKQDQRVLNRLVKTIDGIKIVDPDNMGALDLEKLATEHVAQIAQEWKTMQQTMKIAQGKVAGDADITVSGI